MTNLQRDFGDISEWRFGRSVSLDQAATLLGVSRRTVYNRIKDGRLQTVRTLGGSQRVVVESLFRAGRRPLSPTSSPQSLQMQALPTDR